MVLIVLLYVFACKPKIVTPSITGKQVQHSYLAQATKNPDRVIRGRAFQILLRGAGSEEWQHWWPRLVADQTTDLQLEVLQSILPENPPAALLLVVVENPDFSPAERCRALLMAKRHGITFKKVTLPTTKSMEDRLFCSLYQAIDKQDTRSLQALLQYETLPVNVAFFEELRDSGLTGLSPALRAAFELAEEYYMITLGCAWLRLDPIAARPHIEEFLAKSSEAERLEAVDLLQVMQSESEKKILQKLAAGKDRSALHARIMLTRLRAAYPKLAVQQLEENEDRELTIISAQTLGRWLQNHPGKTVKVEKALINQLFHPDAFVRAAVVKALGDGKVKRGWKMLRELQKQDKNVAVQIEIEGALRAISTAVR